VCASRTTLKSGWYLSKWAAFDILCVSLRIIVCLHFIFINDIVQHIKGFGNRSNKSETVDSELKNGMKDERTFFSRSLNFEIVLEDLSKQGFGHF